MKLQKYFDGAGRRFNWALCTKHYALGTKVLRSQRFDDRWFKVLNTRPPRLSPAFSGTMAGRSNSRTGNRRMMK